MSALVTAMTLTGLLITMNPVAGQTGEQGGTEQWDPAALRPHLDTAIQAAAWIESVRVKTEHGVIWPIAPDAGKEIDDSLYSGSPGVILFLLELHRATGEIKYLDEATAGADELVHRLSEEEEKTRSRSPGLWTGLAGQAFTLLEIHDATGKPEYLAAAENGVAAIARLAEADPDHSGVRFRDGTDIISGSAGIGLFLLDFALRQHDIEALRIDTKIGDHLVGVGRRVELSETEFGLKWAMTPEYPRLMPNFSHGTAGVCSFLTRLHQALASQESKIPEESRDRFLNAALAGGRYLLSIADTSDEGCKVFRHEPGGEDLYYLGWCHGPPGTSRLFLELSRATGDDEWMRWVHRGAASIMESGIPEQRTPGFWNNVGQCCGSVGIASYCLDLHRLSGREAYLNFARRLTEDVLRRAERVELPAGRIGLKWVQAEHRVQPDMLQAQTGFMQGAAGIGVWLLKLDAHEGGRRFRFRLPDAPLWRSE